MVNNQNQRKVFLVIIAILLIANIAILAFFLQKKEPAKQANNRPDRKTVITNFLKNDIGFNQAQLVQFDTLSSRHRETIKGMYEKAKNSKNDQFKQLLAGDFSDAAINNITDSSAADQKMIEVNMLTHIKNIRQLCTPQQLPKFDSTFTKVFNRKGGDGRKKTTK